MNKLLLQTIEKKAVPILKKAGVTRSSVFGSVARGEVSDKSDIDLLIDLPRGKSLFDLAGLQSELEKTLGKKVDLLTYSSIYPRLREQILSEQIEIL